MEYANNACRPGPKEKIVEMAINGVGVWNISPNAVTAVLKNGKFRKTSTPLAYTFGTREDKYLDELLVLLKPYSTGKVYADNHFAYEKRIPAERLVTGKKNTQRMERDHLTLRTCVKRLCRKTICFSKRKEIHIAVVGTFH